MNDRNKFAKQTPAFCVVDSPFFFFLANNDGPEADAALDAAAAAFLFLRAPKERLRLAFSLDAPLVIHLFVIMVFVECGVSGRHRKMTHRCAFRFVEAKERKVVSTLACRRKKVPKRRFRSPSRQEDAAAAAHQKI